jgi:hypothetical protein
MKISLNSGGALAASGSRAGRLLLSSITRAGSVCCCLLCLNLVAKKKNRAPFVVCRSWLDIRGDDKLGLGFLVEPKRCSF